MSQAQPREQHPASRPSDALSSSSFSISPSGVRLDPASAPTGATLPNPLDYVREPARADAPVSAPLLERIVRDLEADRRGQENKPLSWELVQRSYLSLGDVLGRLHSAGGPEASRQSTWTSDEKLAFQAEVEARIDRLVSTSTDEALKARAPQWRALLRQLNDVPLQSVRRIPGSTLSPAPDGQWSSTEQRDTVTFPLQELAKALRQLDQHAEQAGLGKGLLAEISPETSSSQRADLENKARLIRHAPRAAALLGYQDATFGKGAVPAAQKDFFNLLYCAELHGVLDEYLASPAGSPAALSASERLLQLGATHAMGELDPDLPDFKRPLDRLRTALGRRLVKTGTSGLSREEAYGLAVRIRRRVLQLTGNRSRLALRLRPKHPALASIGGRYNAYLFGRDSLMSASAPFMLKDFPRLAQVTLERNFIHQGKETCLRNDEEFGRGPHEVRLPGDAIGASPHLQSWAKEPGVSGISKPIEIYATTEATATGVSLAWAYGQRVGARAFSRWLNKSLKHSNGETVSNLESIARATGWVLGRLNEPTGKGFLFNKPLNEQHGLQFQNWKDSVDSATYPDGSAIPRSAVTVQVEVQAHAYDALLAAASILETHPLTFEQRTALSARVGHGLSAEDFDPASLRARARRLQTSFLERFWMEREGTFAQLLVEDGKGDFLQVPHVTVNAGELLAHQILQGSDSRHAAMARATAERLMQPDMLAPSGLRTLATGSPEFLGSSYQRGSVWHAFTLKTADGMQAHGLTEPARQLRTAALRSLAISQKGQEYDLGSEGMTEPWMTLKEHQLLVRTPFADFHQLAQETQGEQGWTEALAYSALREMGVLGGPGGRSEPKAPLTE